MVSFLPPAVCHRFSLEQILVRRADNEQDSGAGSTFDSEPELTHAMDRLLEDDSLRKQFGVLGVQAYQQGWTVKVHLHRYFALIRELMAANREKPPHNPERSNTH